jgi:uncharacterized Zn finger protein
MAVTLTTFSEADVADWFATRDINKAKPYVDLVRDLEIKGNQLSALVPGSAPQPYISIRPSAASWTIAVKSPLLSPNRVYMELVLTPHAADIRRMLASWNP